MSILKNKLTEYTTETTDVKYRLAYLKMKNVDDKPNIHIHCVLVGQIDGTTGIVDRKVSNLLIDDLLDGFSTAEKQATKLFLSAVERVACMNDPELAGEIQDDTDVF